MGTPLTFDRTALHASLTLHEGLRLKAYRDTNDVLTIGVGHNLTANGISHRVAEILLDDDIDTTVAGLQTTLPWIGRLSDGRLRALIDLAFQFGVTGLLRALPDVVHELERSCWECAARRLEASQYFQHYPTRAKENAALIRG